MRLVYNAISSYFMLSLRNCEACRRNIVVMVARICPRYCAIRDCSICIRDARHFLCN